MIVRIKIAKEKGAGWWEKKKKAVALNYLKYNSLLDKFWAATQQDCYSSPIIYLTLRGTERRTGWISVIWMRVSWIWWYRPVRDFIRFQIQWPDRQWGYDHRNQYSQSPVIRPSISSLDLSTLLHWIWWKCNRSVLAGWWARIPASQKRWSRSGFDAPHVNKSGFVFFKFGLGMVRQSETSTPPALSLEHQGPAVPSDPCIYAALWNLVQPNAWSYRSPASYITAGSNMSEPSQEQQNKHLPNIRKNPNRKAI